ncbi:DUF1835 domain-containing protein [Tistrella mobilis]|uniref:DUF1835 domain-containing protein n=1 Tax=Tistrella mobilis TaxID=171437 RepID=UPI0035572F02
MTDRRSAPAARPEPFLLDLDQQRRQARDLLRAARAGDPDALARLHRHWHRADRPAVLADALHVIARELGLASWPKLKAHIAALDAAGAAIADAQPVADEAPGTLHLRCGSDIRDGLRLAGFTGDFLEVSDPICHGPVPEGDDIIGVRARFIAGSYQSLPGLTVAAVTDKLTREAEGLAAAAGGTRPVVLWMEHDPYDQLILARCLAAFAAAGRSEGLQLILRDGFPGRARFVGLGQLPPPALRLLWAERRPVTRDMLGLGQAVWAALRRPDPRDLAAIAAGGTPVLPQMAPALRRYLAELPGLGDGLSLTERLTLEMIAEAPDAPPTAGRLFGRLMRETDPLPWLGDAMYLAILHQLAQARDPAIRLVDAADGDPYRAVVALTGAGRAVLAGRRDALGLAPPPRQLGGVQIDPTARHWRWDREAECVVEAGPAIR